MKYVTVPSLKISPVDSNGSPWPEKDPTDPTGVKTRPIGEFDQHRYIMVFIVNETEIKKEPGQEPVRVTKIGTGYEGNKRIRNLDRGFQRKANGCCGGCVLKDTHAECVVEVEETDWKIVEQIIEKKQWGVASFGAQFVDFEEAWMNKKDKKPESGELKAV